LANFEPAYLYTIVNEVKAYGTPNAIWYTNTPGDKGGETAWGITLQRARQLGYMAPMNAMREDEAKEMYQRGYWRFGGLLDQRVASKIFDMSVNFDDGTGPGSDRSIRFAQQVVRPGDAAFCDGRWGPRTEEAINNFDTTDMLVGLVGVCDAYYRRLAKADPSQVEFLNGWIKRASRLPKE